VRIDQGAPLTTLTGQPDSSTISTEAIFTFEAQDILGSGVAGFECSLDSAAFTACTSPQTYAGLSSGSHTFAVRAVDNVGNLDATPANATWTVATSGAEIEVQGQGVSIASGDTTPGLADGTDFGAAALNSPVVRILTIQNTGTADLTLGTVTTSGAHAGDFVLTSQPAAPVTAGSSTTFQITFTPSDKGLRTATLSIPTNDSDEQPYTFAVQGSGAENVNSQVGKLRTGLTYTPGANPPATLGTYSLVFNYTNNSGRELHNLFFKVTVANNAYLMNADGGPGGMGAQQALLNSTLGPDESWQPGETLTAVSHQVGVSASSWQLTLVLYAVDHTARGAVQVIGTIVLDDTQFSLQDRVLFLPLIHH
jgi:hypothetical protein